MTETRHRDSWCAGVNAWGPLSTVPHPEAARPREPLPPVSGTRSRHGHIGPAVRSASCREGDADPDADGESAIAHVPSDLYCHRATSNANPENNEFAVADSKDQGDSAVTALLALAPAWWQEQSGGSVLGGSPVPLRLWPGQLTPAPAPLLLKKTRAAASRPEKRAAGFGASWQPGPHPSLLFPTGRFLARCPRTPRLPREGGGLLAALGFWPRLEHRSGGSRLPPSSCGARLGRPSSPGR